MRIGKIVSRLSFILLLIIVTSCKTTETSVLSTNDEIRTISSDTILSLITNRIDNIDIKDYIQQRSGEIVIQNDTILFNIILKEHSIVNSLKKNDSIKYINSNHIRDTIYIYNNTSEKLSNKDSFFDNLGKRSFLFMLLIVLILIIYIIYKRR